MNLSPLISHSAETSENSIMDAPSHTFEFVSLSDLLLERFPGIEVPATRIFPRCPTELPVRELHHVQDMEIAVEPIATNALAGMDLRDRTVPFGSAHRGRPGSTNQALQI